MIYTERECDVSALPLGHSNDMDLVTFSTYSQGKARCLQVLNAEINMSFAIIKQSCAEESGLWNRVIRQ